MLERAAIIGWKADFRRDEQVGVVFDLVSTAGAQALGIGNYGITVGGAAKLATIAASCVARPSPLIRHAGSRCSTARSWLATALS
jgi:cytosine deaminase